MAAIDLRNTHSPANLTPAHIREAVLANLPALAAEGGSDHVKPYVPGDPTVEW